MKNVIFKMGTITARLTGSRFSSKKRANMAQTRIDWALLPLAFIGFPISGFLFVWAVWGG